MVYLLDTNVLVTLIRTRADAIKRRLRRHASSVMGVSVITACELQYGIERLPTARRAAQQHLLEEFLAPFDIWPLEANVVECYGRIRSALADAGQSIGPLDTLIAAHAVALDATLITGNIREFSRVPGLVVEDWVATRDT
jgi:tRNA(fMet)-specific endonuclease VapC